MIAINSKKKYFIFVMLRTNIHSEVNVVICDVVTGQEVRIDKQEQKTRVHAENIENVLRITVPQHGSMHISHRRGGGGESIDVFALVFILRMVYIKHFKQVMSFNK